MAEAAPLILGLDILASMLDLGFQIDSGYTDLVPSEEEKKRKALIEEYKQYAEKCFVFSNNYITGKITYSDGKGGIIEGTTAEWLACRDEVDQEKYDAWALHQQQLKFLHDNDLQAEIDKEKHYTDLVNGWEASIDANPGPGVTTVKNSTDTVNNYTSTPPTNTSTASAPTKQLLQQYRNICKS